MRANIVYLFLSTFLVAKYEASRILAVFPTPSISHQVVFRSLIMGLVNRGHQVVVITCDPAFKSGEAPANLKEIDVHDISYGIWRKGFTSTKTTSGSKSDMINQLAQIDVLFEKIFQKQLSMDEVQKMLKDKSVKFDLLLLEAFYSPLLVFSYVYKAPVILISSMGTTEDNVNTVGAVSHPLLYPTNLHQRIYNLTLWDKLSELRNQYNVRNLLEEDYYNRCCEKLSPLFGVELPPLKELRKNVDMLFLNVHSIWENNRPVPPNVVYLGGMHQNPEKELPQDLKTYLDSSKHGVIYISFGTNIEPAMLPPEKIQAIINVVSILDYDVLWKWNRDEFPGQTPNIKIAKWFPQSDLLRHPKVKLFITQGGLQSTDEAITAGVPLIGLPMLVDQWMNCEKYVHHQIGIKIDMETITEDKLRNAVETILRDDRYHQNVIRLRKLMYDQPQTPLERAVWWAEYVIRHSGASHLRTPAANMPWHQYFELELVAYLLFGLLSVMFIIFFSCIYLYKRVCRQYKSAIKIKSH